MRLSSLFISSVSFAVLAVAGGCSQAGKSTPVRMSGVRESTRAWITDGSRARFSDTAHLKGTKYEGWLDERVAVRYGSVAPGEAGYEGEAEWVVEFAEPVAKLAAAGKLGASTKVRLRGMIEGKEMKGLARPGYAPWAPFSIGNNVLTDGATPWMTLEQLDAQSDRFQVAVQFSSRKGQAISHTSRWSDVAPNQKTPPSATVLKIAKGFSQWTEMEYPEWRDIRLVNVGAQGRDSAYVNETGRQWKAAAGTLVHPFEVLEGTARGGFGAAQIRTRMGRQIAAYDSAFVGRMEMNLLDGGRIAGRATLNLVSSTITPH